MPPAMNRTLDVATSLFASVARLGSGLMVGSVGPGHYAFISQGRPIRLVGKN